MLTKILALPLLVFALSAVDAARALIHVDDDECACRLVCIRFAGQDLCSCPITSCPPIGNCDGTCFDVVGVTVPPDGETVMTCRCKTLEGQLCGKDPGCPDCAASAEYQTPSRIVICSTGSCSGSTSCLKPSAGYPTTHVVTACGCR